MNGKKMYYVEKIIPKRCPRCWVEFTSFEDFCPVTHAKTKSHEPLISCNKCHNITLQIHLESHQVSDKEEADKLCKEEGFLGVMEVTAYGNQQENRHIVYVMDRIDDDIKKMSVAELKRQLQEARNAGFNASKS